MAKVEITNKLLKEAIADAEAVRQTAIENAKLSLEETRKGCRKDRSTRSRKGSSKGTRNGKEACGNRSS